MLHQHLGGFSSLISSRRNKDGWIGLAVSLCVLIGVFITTFSSSSSSSFKESRYLCGEVSECFFFSIYLFTLIYHYYWYCYSCYYFIQLFFPFLLMVIQFLSFFLSLLFSFLIIYFLPFILSFDLFLSLLLLLLSLNFCSYHSLLSLLVYHSTSFFPFSPKRERKK